MKKTMIQILAGFALVSAACAEVDIRTLSATASGTNAATASGTVRGVINEIIVIVPAGMTSDVSIVTSTSDKIFSASDLTGTTYYHPLYAASDYEGNSITDPDYVAKGVASTLTATFTKSDSGTGTVSAAITYIK